MESLLGGFQLPFQRRLTRIYTDTKSSYDFVKEPVQTAEDPDLTSLHRKLRIQKDRLVSWGLGWSDPSQSPDIDESLSKAGLSDIVGNVMSTIQDILAEAEPLWRTSKRSLDAKIGKKAGDSKTALIQWDRSRFEDLIRDLTGSIDILYDLSRTRENARHQSPTMKREASSGPAQMKGTITERARLFNSTRMKTPQQIDPSRLLNPRVPGWNATKLVSSEHFSGGESPSRQIVHMRTQTTSTNPWKSDGPPPLVPVLLEYAAYDPIYASTGIPPSMDRFESLFAGLQMGTDAASRPDFGILSLVGYFEDIANARFGLVHQLPKRFTGSVNLYSTGPSLVTLSNILSMPETEPALEVKYRLANIVASTVLDLHANGIMHGNLTNENLNFIQEPPSTSSQTEPTSPHNFRRPFITSFDLFPETGFSDAEDLSDNLYIHALDPRISNNTSLTHETRSLDLYSLGLLLLEIGLWTPLHECLDKSKDLADLEVAYKHLATRCGSLYLKVVKACINAVESETVFSKEIDAVYAQISATLERCCVIDDGEDEDLNVEDCNAPLSPTSMGQGLPARPTVSDFEVDQKMANELNLQHIVPQPLTYDHYLSNTKSKDIHIGDGNDTKTKDDSTTLDTPPKPKQRLFSAVKVEQRHLDHWHAVLMPQINRTLRNFYRKYPESVEISLEPIGDSADKTKPTILVVCTSVGKVRSILKKHFPYDSSTYGLLVCKGRVVRSRKQPRRSTAGNAQFFTEPKNAMHEERPFNGASIGAYADGQHLAPVSFGGMVMINDKPYGLTVHHMLDDPSEQEQLTSLPENHRSSDLGLTSTMDDLEDDTGKSIVFSDYDSDDYSETASDDESDYDSDDEARIAEIGDVEGIAEDCGEGYAITQPALDDVEEGFFASDEAAEEDHLETFKLGEVYASSGIRRNYLDGIAHEIDWALFEFAEDRQPEENHIKGGDQHCLNKLQYPIEVAPWSSLHGLEIHCNARTTGLQKGRIQSGMTSVKIYGRQTPSQSYQVSGNIGMPGDSGAWIVDNAEGRVCGHVLAWSSKKHVAYICPMEILLSDIAQTLGKVVSLPGATSPPIIAIESSPPPYIDVGHIPLEEDKNAEEWELDLNEDDVDHEDNAGVDLDVPPPARSIKASVDFKHVSNVRYNVPKDERLADAMRQMHISHELVSSS